MSKKVTFMQKEQLITPSWVHAPFSSCDLSLQRTPIFAHYSDDNPSTGSSLSSFHSVGKIVLHYGHRGIRKCIHTRKSLSSGLRQNPKNP